MTVRSRGTQKWRVCAALAVLAIAAGACNALNGSQDRVLAEDAGVLAAIESGASPDASDSGVRNVPVSSTFVSKNGATIVTSGGATQFTAFGADHGLIVPVPPPAIDSEVYTVTARVRLAHDAEFGILVRGQADGSGFVCGSKLGSDFFPFVGWMAPPNWNPAVVAQDYTEEWTPPPPDKTYLMKVQVTLTQITAKVWDVTLPEPTRIQVIAPQDPSATGQVIGFYDYSSTDVFLESLQVTVP